MVANRKSATCLVKTLTADPQFRDLASPLRFDKSSVTGKSLSPDQRMRLRNLSSDTTGQILDLATRLELCRPNANHGQPLSLERNLEFLTRLEKERDELRKVRESLQEEYSTPKDVTRATRYSSYIGPGDEFIKYPVMLDLAQAAVWEQCSRWSSSYEFELNNSDLFNSVSRRELNEFIARLLNVAMSVSVRIFTELVAPIKRVHNPLNGDQAAAVSSWEYDFASERELIEMKCSSDAFRSSKFSEAESELGWLCQLLLYWRLGLASNLQNVRTQFHRLERLSVVNPILGKRYLLPLHCIPQDLVSFVDTAIGISAPNG